MTSRLPLPRLAGRTIALAVSVGLMLAGCGGSEGSESSSTSESPSESRASEFPATEESTSTEDPYAPNVGDRALVIGEKRVGSAVTTTLHRVRLPMPPGEYREPAAGNVFIGLRVEQCLDSDADMQATGEVYAAFSDEWAAVAPSGAEYSGGSSWNDWPSPKFPEGVSMIPGRCLTGWLTLEAPERTKVASILYRSQGIAVAEWYPKD